MDENNTCFGCPVGKFQSSKGCTYLYGEADKDKANVICKMYQEKAKYKRYIEEIDISIQTIINMMITKKYDY